MAGLWMVLNSVGVFLVLCCTLFERLFICVDYYVVLLVVVLVVAC